MSHQSELIATDIEAYLAEHEQKDLLRFLTCGSVDDGKSTLIGRLLHDSHLLYEDQLAAVEAESTTIGSAGGELDLALLMDGLKAEREQGITIDVAYRYFSTSRRKFIIADTPGHEQYTRNMVTGASTCDLAIILVDARHGVQAQTKRHSYLTSLLGIENTVVAINKMDLVDHSKERFEEIRDHYLEFAERLDLKKAPWFIPISALKGDWVVDPGTNMTWFEGPTLMEHLETVPVTVPEDGDLRFPVQLVRRPDLTFRGFAGTVASGVVQPGDEVMVLPSGVVTTVDRLVTFNGDLDEAGPGTAVTMTLTDEVDVSRGDVLVHPERRPQRSHEVDAMVVWMSETDMAPGKEYLVQQANRIVPGRITTMAHRIDINTLEPEAAAGLAVNEIGRCTVTCDQQLLFDAYERNRTTGRVHPGRPPDQRHDGGGHDPAPGLGLGRPARRAPAAPPEPDHRGRAGEPLRPAPVHRPADRAHGGREVDDGGGPRAAPVRRRPSDVAHRRRGPAPGHEPRPRLQRPGALREPAPHGRGGPPGQRVRDHRDRRLLRPPRPTSATGPGSWSAPSAS